MVQHSSVHSSGLRRAIATAGAAIVGLAVALMVSASASAWNPLVTGKATCADNGWSVTWTVRPDADRPALTWWITSPAGFQPAGPKPATADSTFTRTDDAIPFTTDSVSVTVTATWSSGNTADASATVSRPYGCSSTGTTTTMPGATTTVDTGGAPTTTTTMPATTTTQVGSGGGTTTSTLPATTTTQVGSGGGTTTTVTGSGGPTTTLLSSGGGGSTTTQVASGAPTTTISPQLPQTGGGSPALIAMAFGVLALGAIVSMLTRRSMR